MVQHPLSPVRRALFWMGLFSFRIFLLFGLTVISRAASGRPQPGLPFILLAYAGEAMEKK